MNQLEVQMTERRFYNRRASSNITQQFDKLNLAQAQSRIEEHIKLQLKEKKGNDSANIINCLSNHFIFYNLSPQQLENVKEHMFYCEVKQGQQVYSFHDFGTCFFIVERGSLEMVSADHDRRKILKTNDGFGQLALLYHSQRNSQVTACEDCTLWVIDRLTFRHAVEEMIVQEYTENKKCFETVRFFANLRPDQKDIIASSLIRQQYYKGQSIIQQGDPGSIFYYIKEGNASVYKGTRFQRRLTKGDSFGQQSLYYNTMRQYTIKADDDMVCLLLGRDTLNRIMGDNIYEVTFKNFIRWAFEKNNILNQLSKETQQQLLDEMKISSYKAQESVFRRGIVGFQKLVVVIEGSLKKLKSGNVVATKGQCYGQQFLKDQNKILDDQIIMQNYGVVAQISQQAFRQTVEGKDYNSLIARKKVENESIMVKLEIKNETKTALDKIDLANLEVLATLKTEGQFGPLFLITDGTYKYVLKSIDKGSVEQYDVVKFAIEQGTTLESVSCHFVISMGRKFQSPNYIFYLNEHIKGRQFYDILKSIGLLSSEDSQFYTATIILILEYFAEKGIICRDVKPQNFMVDHAGYLKLINLPTAKILGKDQNGVMKKTSTIIGTPHYMAPDIVIGKGYNNMVDLWSLGVCLYEFLCGVLPFGDASESAYEIYEEIMQTELRFPQFLHDKKAKKLIEQLLSHNPTQRHGGSFAKLKQNQWFDDFKWQALVSRNDSKLRPPTIPMVRQQSSSQNINLKMLDLIKDMESKKQAKQYEQKWSSFDRII